MRRWLHIKLLVSEITGLLSGLRNMVNAFWYCD